MGEGAPAIRAQVLSYRMSLDVADELEEMGIHDTRLVGGDLYGLCMVFIFFLVSVIVFVSLTFFLFRPRMDMLSSDFPGPFDWFGAPELYDTIEGGD